MAELESKMAKLGSEMAVLGLEMANNNNNNVNNADNIDVAINCSICFQLVKDPAFKRKLIRCMSFFTF